MVYRLTTCIVLNRCTSRSRQHSIHNSTSSHAPGPESSSFWRTWNPAPWSATSVSTVQHTLQIWVVFFFFKVDWNVFCWIFNKTVYLSTKMWYSHFLSTKPVTYGNYRLFCTCVGCGNGKYLSINPFIYQLGADRCMQLTEAAREKENEVTQIWWLFYLTVSSQRHDLAKKRIVIWLLVKRDFY